MLETVAVVIAIPGHDTVRIGPFIAPTNAARYATRLRTIASGRRLQAVVYAEPADPGRDHLEPRLPTDPWSLGKLLAEQDNEHGEDVPFPDLYTRLIVQLGEELAEKVWDQATGWSGPHDDQARHTALTESAEEWREKRTRATGALQTIAVELWIANLHNIRQIGAITGLSRANIYACLREHGIEPTDRGEQ